MPRKARNNASPSRVRTYQQILSDLDDPCAGLARQAVRKLTTKYGIAELDIEKRIEFFGAWQHYGSGYLWKERFTISRARARRLARRLRKDAEDLRQAIAPQFKVLIRYSGPISADLICDRVGRAAELIEGSLEETSDRNADWTLVPKRELTQFIWRTTGRPLDGKLSDLIAAILGCDYTYDDQRKFRVRNCMFQATDSIFPATVEPDIIDAKND